MITLNAVVGDPAARHVMTDEETAPIHQSLVQQLDAAAAAPTEDDDNDDDLEITLVLSGRTWPLSTLKVLLPENLLERIVPHLAVLKVDDTTASLRNDGGFAVLQFYNDAFVACPNLREVHLDGLALGTRGLNILRPLISRPTLRVLSLYNTGLAVADVHTLRDILIHDDNNNNNGVCHLRVLTLGRNRFFVDGSMALEKLLAACRHLERFEYIGNSPLKEGSRAIVRGLHRSGNTVMRQLDLDIELGDGSEDGDAVTDFCECLSRWNNLQRLTVSGGELQVDGWERVAEALRNTNVALEHLDLSACQLTAEGVENLRAYLAEEGRAAELSYLGLADNDAEDEGVAVLAEFLATLPKLQGLNLDQNCITAEGARTLIDNPCPHLKYLNVYDNELPLGAVRRLKQMYATVIADDEDDLVDDGDEWGLEEPEEQQQQADEQVDALGDALANAQI